MRNVPNEGWKIRFDWKAAAENLTQNLPALFEAIHSQNPTAIKLAMIPFVGMVTCFESSQTDSALLNRFVQNSIAGALTDICQSFLNDQLDKLEQFSLGELTAPPKEETVIDPNLFEKPGESVLSKTYLQHLCALLTQLEVDTDRIDQVCVAWPLCFTKASQAEWVSDGEYTQNLSNDRFLGPMDPYLTALKDEQAYKQALCRKMTDGLYDGCCTLDQIYIDLKAVCWKSCGSTAGAPTCFLEADLLKWCDNQQPGMVVVKGDPGSGKSTVLKKVARELIRRGKHVIYFDLYKLPFSDRTDCLETIRKELDRLGWYRELQLKSNPDTVYILDGLDEIKANVWNSARNLTGHLVGSEFFETQKIILSGRMAIVAHCEEQLGYLDCYELMSLTGEITSGDCLLPASVNNRVDLRSSLWNKLCTALNLSVSLHNLLAQEHLRELSTSPLLLFLLAWTFQQKPDAVSKIQNTVQLYRQILQCIYQRNHGRNRKNPAGSPLDFKSYCRILHAVGMCAAIHDSRSIELTKIQDYCRFMGLEAEYQKWFTSETADHTSRLFLLFFAHEGKTTQDDSVFEFLHKSFYEYLAAEEIVSQFCHLSNLDPDTAKKRLWYLLSLTTINEILTDVFLPDLISDSPKCFKLFTQNLGNAFRLLHPYNMELDQVLPIQAKHPRRSLSFGALYNQYDALIKNLLYLVKMVFIIEMKNPCFGAYDNLNLSQVYVEHQDLDNWSFYNVDFSHIRLYFCTFVRSELHNGEWNDTSLDHCFFFESNLSNSKAQDAQLDEIDFSYCDIKSSVFSGCEFHDVSFAGSDLFASCWTDCEFFDCSFQNADLENFQILGNCMFDYCNFDNAILKGVSIAALISAMDAADVPELSHTNLDGADWEGVPDKTREKLLQMSEEWHNTPKESRPSSPF